MIGLFGVSPNFGDSAPVGAVRLGKQPPLGRLPLVTASPKQVRCRKSGSRLPPKRNKRNLTRHSTKS